MSYHEGLEEVATIVTNVSANPSYKAVERMELEDLPPGTFILRRFIIEDDGGAEAGPLVGPGSGVRMEHKNFIIRLAYPLEGDRSSIENLIHADHKDVTDALIKRSNWSSSSHIVAILTQTDCRIIRKGKVWQATFKYEAVVNV